MFHRYTLRSIKTGTKFRRFPANLFSSAATPTSSPPQKERIGEFIAVIAFAACTGAIFFYTMNTLPKLEGPLLKTISNEGEYHGTVLEDKRHGHGKMHYTMDGETFDEGTIYIGQWKNDLRHGDCVVEFKNGDKYVGEYRKDSRNGVGTYTYKECGGEYAGYWKSGKMSGDGFYKYANGDYFSGVFQDSKIHNGHYKYNNGDQYWGEFLNDKRHGKGKMVYMNGSEYDGEWKEGKKHGYGTFNLSDKVIQIGLFENDKYKGPAKV